MLNCEFTFVSVRDRGRRSSRTLALKKKNIYIYTNVYNDIYCARVTNASPKPRIRI